jgi:hypothetical protein
MVETREVDQPSPILPGEFFVQPEGNISQTFCFKKNRNFSEAEFSSNRTADHRPWFSARE